MTGEAFEEFVTTDDEIGCYGELTDAAIVHEVQNNEITDVQSDENPLAIVHNSSAADTLALLLQPKSSVAKIPSKLRNLSLSNLHLNLIETIKKITNQFPL